MVCQASHSQVYTFRMNNGPRIWHQAKIRSSYKQGLCFFDYLSCCGHPAFRFLGLESYSMRVAASYSKEGLVAVALFEPDVDCDGLSARCVWVSCVRILSYWYHNPKWDSNLGLLQPTSVDIFDKLNWSAPTAGRAMLICCKKLWGDDYLSILFQYKRSIGDQGSTDTMVMHYYLFGKRNQIYKALSTSLDTSPRGRANPKVIERSLLSQHRWTSTSSQSSKHRRCHWKMLTQRYSPEIDTLKMVSGEYLPVLVSVQCEGSHRPCLQSRHKKKL